MGKCGKAYAPIYIDLPSMGGISTIPTVGKVMSWGASHVSQVIWDGLIIFPEPVRIALNLRVPTTVFAYPIEISSSFHQLPSGND